MESQLVKEVPFGYNLILFQARNNAKKQEGWNGKMAENEMNNMEEDIIVFEDEDGNEYEYSVVDYLFYNGEEYALLVEVTEEENEDDSQECIVCKIVAETEEDGEETESFELVEDEALGQKLVEIFNTKIADEEKEDE